MPKFDGPLDAYDRETSEPQQTRVEVSMFKGRTYFSLRVWYLDDESQTYKPGKNGINLPVEEYPEFRKLITSLDIELGHPAGEPNGDEET